MLSPTQPGVGIGLENMLMLRKSMPPSVLGSEDKDQDSGQVKAKIVGR